MAENIVPSPDSAIIQSANAVLDALGKKTEMDKVQALLKLLEIVEIEITAVGEKFKVHNLELITEYTGQQTTKYMVKNETWRKTAQEVLHLQDITEEKLVGYMDLQIQLKMVSHRRKRAQEIINALKNEVAGTEVIPTKQKTKRFFGMI